MPLDPTTLKTSDISTFDLQTAQEYLKVVKDDNSYTTEKLALMGRIAELEAKSLAYIQDRIRELEKEQKLLNDFEKLYANRGESSKREYEFEANKLKILENQIELAKQGDAEQLENLRQFVDQNKEKLKDSKLDLEIKDDLIAAARVLVNLKKEEVDTAKQLNQQTKDIISSTLGISARWKETFFGKLLDSDGDSLKNMKAIGLAIKDTFTLENVMGSTLMKIQEATVQAFITYDMAASSLAKVAGANEQLQSVLSNTARGATAYGISFEQAGKAIETLYTNLNTFSNLNQGVQEQLTISVAKLDRLGISGQESAKQIGTLSQIMGMSEVQAAKTSEELAGLALAIGKPPQQVAQDFAGASNQLAAYGKNMVNVFKDVEIQSKATGIAVNDLLKITEKFETFEGAAQAAGKLNAALGGGFINAMDLIEAASENPAKAIDLLRTSLDKANVSFDEMSFFEQKNIAAIFGTSIEETSRMLSMTNAEREIELKQKQELADQQKLLNEAIQRSIPLQEKLTMIFVNFGIVMGPVVDGLSSVLSFLAEVADTAGGKTAIAILGIISALAMLVRTVNIFRSAVSAAGGFMNMIMAFLNPAAGKLAEKAGEGIGEGMKKAGEGGMKGAPGIAAAGAALIEFGLGIALIVLPVAALVAAMGYLVRGFAELFNVILGKGDGVATTLATLGAAMFAIGIAFNNPIILIGMGLFSAALLGIVAAMTLLPEKKVVSFATISENLVKLGSIEGTSNTIQQASELVKTINEFKLDDKVSANLEKILKAAIPQQQTTQTQQQFSPVIKVFIGDKEVQGLITKVETGSMHPVGTLNASPPRR